MNDEEIARRIRIEGSREDWASIKAYIRQLPPQTAFVFLRALGARLPQGVDAEHAIEGLSDSLGRTVAGAIAMVRAASARGMDTADRVSEDSWQAYFAYRERAEQLLRYASTSDPKSGLAAAWYMTAAIDGGEEMQEEALHFLDRAERVPISGYSSLLTSRMEKWGGSHESMWETARSLSDIREPWSLSFIAKAHYEQWLYLELMDDRPVAEYEAAAYFQNRDVREELLNISEALFAAETEDPYEAIFAHDVLAATLAEARLRKPAIRHLRRVGQFGDPALLTGGSKLRQTVVRLMYGLPPW